MAKNTETKGIAFKGIERINTRINTNDGACEEIINVRPEGNTWNNVKDRTKIQDLVKIIENFTVPDYEIIIHPASEEKYYIFWDKVLGVFLLDRTSSFPIDYGDINRICVKLDVEGKILSVSYLDNVLIVCAETGKYMFLYKRDGYERVDVNNCRINIDAIGVPKREDTTDTNWSYEDGSVKVGKNLVACHYGRSKKLYPLYKQTRTDDFNPVASKVQVKEISSLAQDVLSRMMNESGTIRDDKLFYGMSFYRVALKLYDGSYVNYSNIAYADTNGDDYRFTGSDNTFLPMTIVGKTESYVSGDWTIYTDVACIRNPCGTHKVTLHFEDKTLLKELMKKKIVESVDVFMTRPVLSADVSKDMMVTSIQGNYFVDPNSQDHHDRAAIIDIRGGFPINIEGIKNSLLNGTYFKIKSYSQADIDGLLTDEKTEEINSDLLQNLEGNKTLPTPNMDNEVVYNSSYTYNQRQHLYDIIYHMFDGYKYSLPIDSVGIDSIDPVLNAVEIRTGQVRDDYLGFYYVIKGQYNDKDFCVKKKIENPEKYFVVFRNILPDHRIYQFHLPRFFNYPTLGGVEVGIYLLYKNVSFLLNTEKKYENIYGGGNINYIAKINDKVYPEATDIIGIRVSNWSDMSFNTEATFSDDTTPYRERPTYSMFGNETIGAISIALPSSYSEKPIEEKTIIEASHILQLTETDNPFVLPNELNYTFGSDRNDIQSIVVNNGMPTDRNFGTYPLYVLTRDGVYTMSVGEDNTAYSRIIQLNNYKVKNREVLNTPNGIMFLSEEGLMLMNGKSINCISNLVKGKPTMNRYASDMAYITPMDSDFLLEIANSQMYYDEEHAEVNVVVKGYTYVYNIKLGNWYKRADKYKVERNNKLTRIDITDAEGYRYKNIALYEIKEGDEVKDNVMIFTKPLALDTRQSKHIERTIVDMQWMTDENFSIQIWASNDGVNYKVVKEYINDQKSGKPFSMQDVYLARVLGSMKYISLMITGKLSDIRLQSAMIQFKQVRNVIGIK